MKQIFNPVDSSRNAPGPSHLCPTCGTATRIGAKECVNCLLREGLGTEVESSRAEFERVLEEASVPDQSWRLGNYDVLEEIGRGGMGVIYRARQRPSQRIVALKRVLAGQVDAPETLARFRREAEAAASLDHPHILPIYEVSESESGLPFFSMKFAAGGSLRTAAIGLRSRPHDCVQLVAKVAHAIAYAHEHKILHRDLQPGNILLDPNGEPFVSDFGLAKWLDETSDLTRTLTTFGTPGFIAPEQAEGPAADLTPAADIYSLGAILFFLLAGRPPFLGANALTVIHQTVATPAPRLRSLAPAADRDLETIIARCLEREPRARYRSAEALAEDLERWLEGRPILARPVLLPARVWRWSRRNPVLAGAALICFSLGGAVLWLLSEQHSPPRLPPPEKSIAVLPFQNLSQDQENAFFAEGVQDEILSDLAQIADLKVISSTSTRFYEPGKPRNSRQIGEQLGVAHLLEGSVQRLGHRVRFNVQLIDTRTDAHLWAQIYDRDLSNVFALQSEIARTIADQLEAKISKREQAAMAQTPTSDLIANDLYQQARTTESASTDDQPEEKAIGLLEQAIARDPHFLRAYCALGRLDVFLYEHDDHTPARLQQARTAVEKATQLQPDAGEVHLLRANYLGRALRQYDNARGELELARQVLPNDASVYYETALLDRRQGRWAEALRNFNRAIELDPRNQSYLANAAESYSNARKYAEATRLGRRALALSPRGIEPRLFLASLPLNERADLRPLRRELDAILAEKPGAAPALAYWHLWRCAILERDPVATDRALAAMGGKEFHGYLGAIVPRELLVAYAARVFHQPEISRAAALASGAILENHLRAHPDDATTWSLLGRVHSMLGEKEKAIAAGRRACQLFPLSKEAIWGLQARRSLAVIYAWVGEKDLAVQELEAHAQEFYFTDYGELKLDPDWDPLRGDPRFDKIVASLESKEEAATLHTSRETNVLLPPAAPK